MSMLKTREGEIIINRKRGRRGGPAAWPWFRLCLVVWTKQGSQGERTRKLEEEHLWRDVHEVVTFFLSWLPNCVGEKAGVASFTPHFGYSLVYTCTSTVQCRDFPGSILEARLSFYCRELSPFSYTCPFISCYWLCKRRTLRYSQRGKSAGWLLLLSQASGKAGVEEGFWWCGGQQVAGRERKKLCLEDKKGPGKHSHMKGVFCLQQRLPQDAQSIMERKSLSSAINTSPSPGYTQTHKWLRFHSCGLLLYHRNLELYL